MRQKLDDFVSVALALAVSILFVGTSVVRWPHPYRLQKFQIEYAEPFGSFHDHRIHIAHN